MQLFRFSSQQTVGRENRIIADFLQQKHGIDSKSLKKRTEPVIQIRKTIPFPVIFCQCDASFVDQIDFPNLIIISSKRRFLNLFFHLKELSDAVIKRLRLSVIISLNLLTSDASQKIKLALILHPLCQSLNADFLRHIHHRGDNLP